LFKFFHSFYIGVIIVAAAGSVALIRKGDYIWSSADYVFVMIVLAILGGIFKGISDNSSNGKDSKAQPIVYQH